MFKNPKGYLLIPIVHCEAVLFNLSNEDVVEVWGDTLIGSIYTLFDLK